MKSKCCSAPVKAVIADEGTGYYQCLFCLEVCDIKAEKKHKIIKAYWNKLQEENEDALHAPWIDAGRVCIALGWGLVWMGVGILIGILILI